MAALASVMIVGWQGSAINALGQGYELRVIASTVIGGADLMGGEGGAYGAVIGAALIEVIRNSLLMAGVDANWQGAFVGLFIVSGGSAAADPRQACRPERCSVRIITREEERSMKILMTYGAAAAALLWHRRTAPGAGEEIHLRARAEEHEQPVLRPGPRRLQEGREGIERHDRVPCISAPASMAAATSRSRSSTT